MKRIVKLSLKKRCILVIVKIYNIKVMHYIIAFMKTIRMRICNRSMKLTRQLRCFTPSMPFHRNEFLLVSYDEDFSNSGYQYKRLINPVRFSNNARIR